LYETFPPEEGFRLSQRLEIHYTPQHGGWLDFAEIELSALAAQRLGNRRVPSIKAPNKNLRGWETTRNAAQKGAGWRFTTDAARTKLKLLHPVILQGIN
jgi:hypothetical protein